MNKNNFFLNIFIKLNIRKENCERKNRGKCK